MTKIEYDETATLNREVKANHLNVSIFHYILSSRFAKTNMAKKIKKENGKSVKRSPNSERIVTTKAKLEKLIAEVKGEGNTQGAEMALNLVVWILRDKNYLTNEQLTELSKEVDYQLDSIIKGYLSYSDIKNDLKKQGWAINLVDKGGNDATD